MILNKKATAISEYIPNDFKIRKVANCFQRKFSKAKFGRQTYHSLEEYYKAALLEIDPNVVAFTPQPKQYGTFGNRYIPDFHYLLKDGSEFVIELKPQGKLSDRYLRPMKAIAERDGFSFEVVANEEVRKQEILALNSIHIASILSPVTYMNTDEEEQEILRRVLLDVHVPLKQFVYREDRIGRQSFEIGIFRMLMAGKLEMELATQRISFDSVLRIAK